MANNAWIKHGQDWKARAKEAEARLSKVREWADSVRLMKNLTGEEVRYNLSLLLDSPGQDRSVWAAACHKSGCQKLTHGGERCPAGECRVKEGRDRSEKQARIEELEGALERCLEMAGYPSRVASIARAALKKDQANDGAK